MMPASTYCSSVKMATARLRIAKVGAATTGDKQERTDFFRIKCFGSQAEAHGKYLGKGSLVFVQGKIRNTKYEKDGQTVYGTDFIADKVDYLDTKAPGGSNQE